MIHLAGNWGYPVSDEAVDCGPVTQRVRMCNDMLRALHRDVLNSDTIDVHAKLCGLLLTSVHVGDEQSGGISLVQRCRAYFRTSTPAVSTIYDEWAAREHQYDLYNIQTSNHHDHERHRLLMRRNHKFCSIRGVRNTYVLGLIPLLGRLNEEVPADQSRQYITSPAFWGAAHTNAGVTCFIMWCTESSATARGHVYARLQVAYAEWLDAVKAGQVQRSLKCVVHEVLQSYCNSIGGNANSQRFALIRS